MRSEEERLDTEQEPLPAPPGLSVRLSVRRGAFPAGFASPFAARSKGGEGLGALRAARVGWRSLPLSLCHLLSLPGAPSQVLPLQGFGGFGFSRGLALIPKLPGLVLRRNGIPCLTINAVFIA